MRKFCWLWLALLAVMATPGEAAQRRALLDVERTVVPQQDGVGRCAGAVDGVEHVATVAGGDVDDAHRHAGGARGFHRIAQELFQMAGMA